MYVLGIWDGHDSGAALIRDNEIVYAANEERFTKRKLEMNFPYNSIAAALKHAGIKPHEIEHIAFTTTEFTKTLERMIPSDEGELLPVQEEEDAQAQVRERKAQAEVQHDHDRHAAALQRISSIIVSGKLTGMGFKNYKLHMVDHHTAHAATAAFTRAIQEGAGGNA